MAMLGLCKDMEKKVHVKIVALPNQAMEVPQMLKKVLLKKPVYRKSSWEKWYRARRQVFHSWAESGVTK